tara:strand:- start:29 stop:328 length:300 start_codon:yes stop_codon:yes gene_type:complete
MNNEIKLDDWANKNTALQIIDEVYMVGYDENIKAGQNIAYNLTQDMVRYGYECSAKAVLLKLDKMTDKRFGGYLKDDKVRNSIKAIKNKYMKQLSIKFY